VASSTVPQMEATVRRLRRSGLLPLCAITWPPAPSHRWRRQCAGSGGPVSSLCAPLRGLRHRPAEGGGCAPAQEVRSAHLWSGCGQTILECC
jgi:hypothetical protein